MIINSSQRACEIAFTRGEPELALHEVTALSNLEKVKSSVNLQIQVLLYFDRMYIFNEKFN